MNGSFSKPEVLIRTGDGHAVILWEDFSFTRPSGELVEFKRLGWSDGASTPSVIWNKFPPFGPWWLAALGHDLLYRYSQRPKDECDLLLKEMMEALGCDELTISIFVTSVRAFGQTAFVNDRKNQTKTP